MRNLRSFRIRKLKRLPNHAPAAAAAAGVVRPSRPMALNLRQPDSVWNHVFLSAKDFSTEEMSDNNNNKKILNSLEESLRTDVLPLLGSNVSKITMVMGVSGGCDSICLLHATHQVLKRTQRLQVGANWDLHVAHFDHRLRSEESDGDRIFVENLCQDLQIPCHTYLWEEGGDESSFSHDTARAWRRQTMYKLLKSLTKDRGVILTAHHRDDSTETLLLKLLRGVHLTNIAGMQPAVQPEDMPNAIVSRPLLRVTKKEIQEFLMSQGFEWREDSSNASNKYKRNQVRNQLLPLMSEIVGGDDQLSNRLANLAEQSSDLREYLQKEVDDYLNKTGSLDLFVLPDSITLNFVHKEAFHRWSTTKMQTHSIPYDQLQRVCRQLEEHSDRQQWSLNIGNGWDVVRNGGVLDVVAEGDSEQVTNPGGDDTVLQITSSETASALIHINTPEPLNREFLLSKAGKANTWLFTPPWRAGHSPSKMKDFLRGQKVPLHERPETPIIYTFQSGSPVVVGVHVNGKWVVSADYEAKEGSRLVILCKASG